MADLFTLRPHSFCMAACFTVLLASSSRRFLVPRSRLALAAAPADDAEGERLFGADGALPVGEALDDGELPVGEAVAADDSRRSPRPTRRMWLGRRLWVPKPGELQMSRDDQTELIVVNGVSPKELRARRAAQQRANAATLRERLCSLGVAGASVTRLLATPAVLAATAPSADGGTCLALRQLETLLHLLPEEGVAGVLRRHGRLLLSREMDLAARVEALQAATDLPALRLVSHEPGMLSLDHTHVAARCAALSAALGGGVEVGLVLRRAPRLLSRSPARVQRTLAALRDLLEPLGLDALQLARLEAEYLPTPPHISPDLPRSPQISPDLVRLEAEYAFMHPN